MKRVLSLPGIEVYEVPVGLEPHPDLIKAYIFLDVDSKIMLLADPGPLSRCDAVRGGVEVFLDRGYELPSILITHIHIDHYGAATRLAKELGAKVLLHPRAVKHVAEPSKLWASSLEVMGNRANEYGKPYPLEEELVRPVNDGELLKWGRVQVETLHTPGHAPHHQVYILNDALLISGDAAGGYNRDLDVVFTTSPPGLRLDLYMESLDKIEAKGFKYLAVTHMDIAEKGKEALRRHRRQMEAWRQKVSELLSRGVEPKLADLLEVDAELSRYMESLRKTGLYPSIEGTIKSGFIAVVMEVRRLMSSQV
ncbi:MAG: MBL fold metallo-hydrolase [Desulfurococcaceae archaeon]